MSASSSLGTAGSSKGESTKTGHQYDEDGGCNAAFSLSVAESVYTDEEEKVENRGSASIMSHTGPAVDLDTANEYTENNLTTSKCTYGYV